MKKHCGTEERFCTEGIFLDHIMYVHRGLE